MDKPENQWPWILLGCILALALLAYTGYALTIDPGHERWAGSTDEMR